jgi:hypothetical protein
MRASLVPLWISLAFLPALGCVGPFGGGSGDRQEVVQDPRVLEFADRIQAFYGSIQQIPLDVRITYDNSKLRSFFANEADFATYYAQLAGELRRAQFRNATLQRVLIREFRFDGEGVAKVDLMLFGRHERALRLGELQLARSDVWQLRDGSWLVTPDKL